MPSFDFQCDGKCGKTTTLFLAFEEEPPKRCPHCRSRKFTKLFNFVCKTVGKGRITTVEEVKAALVIHLTGNHKK